MGLGMNNLQKHQKLLEETERTMAKLKKEAEGWLDIESNPFHIPITEREKMALWLERLLHSDKDGKKLYEWEDLNNSVA